MAKLIVFLLIALVIEAVGVVYLSHGLKQMGEVSIKTPGAIRRLVVQCVTNRHLVIGTILETTFFVMLLFLLKNNDVSLIWPLTSLGFVLTALAARFIRHEEVSSLRWSGVILIVVGAALVGWSEKLKSPPGPPARAESPKTPE